MYNYICNDFTYSLFPEPEVAIGFFLLFPDFRWVFSFSARSKYWTHLARIVSLDLSPWASSKRYILNIWN